MDIAKIQVKRGEHGEYETVAFVGSDRTGGSIFDHPVEYEQIYDIRIVYINVEAHRESGGAAGCNSFLEGGA